MSKAARRKFCLSLFFTHLKFAVIVGSGGVFFLFFFLPSNATILIKPLTVVPNT